MAGDTMLSETAVAVMPPRAALHGRVRLPGSKSVTNRVLLLGALARGRSRLTGAGKSDDTAHMARALRAMGVEVEEPDPTTFLVTGTGGLRAPSEPVFLGNAGTAMRFLAAAAALADGPGLPLARHLGHSIARTMGRLALPSWRDLRSGA